MFRKFIDKALSNAKVKRFIDKSFNAIGVALKYWGIFVASTAIGITIGICAKLMLTLLEQNVQLILQGILFGASSIIAIRTLITILHDQNTKR